MNRSEADGSKSLQELEGVDWGSATTAETPMIGQLLALRRKPLRDLSAAEVRLAVSQKVGFPYTLELALERLSSNPLVEGENYPGDILAALLRVEDGDWVGRDALRARLTELFTRVMSLTGEDADEFRQAAGLPSNGSCLN
jgi:hypothetical protein